MSFFLEMLPIHSQKEKEIELPHIFKNYQCKALMLSFSHSCLLHTINELRVSCKNGEGLMYHNRDKHLTVKLRKEIKN